MRRNFCGILHLLSLLTSCLLGLPGSQAQIIYTAGFTRLLQEAEISYAMPVENYLHVIMPPEDGFMAYALVLENDRGDFEVRYRFHDARESVVPAAVTVAGLIASIASNDPETEIRIQVPADTMLHTAFNAEKGLISYFTPKQEFSGKPYGAMINLSRSGRPAVDIVILYTDPAFNPELMFRTIRYR